MRLTPLTFKPPRLSLLLPVIFVTLVSVLLVPTFAYADVGNVADPSPPSQFVLPTAQLWTLVAGAIITLPTFLINKYGPMVTEPQKAVVHTITAAISGGIVQAITAGDVGFNQTTLQFVVTAIVAAAFATAWWKRTGIGLIFGQGQNKPSQVPGPLQAAGG